MLLFIPSQKKSQNHTVSVNGVLKKSKLNPVEKEETNLQTFSMHQAWRVHEQSNSRPSTSVRITKVQVHKSDKHCSPQIEGFLEMERKCQKFRKCSLVNVITEVREPICANAKWGSYHWGIVRT